MANTGKKIVLTLKERKDPAGTFTGNTKSNVPSDVDYIPDYVDLVACPITYSTTCPVVVSTKTGTSLYYEFNLPNEVAKNPVLKKVNVATSVGGFLHSYVIPNSPSENYFSDVFTGMNAVTHYDLVITYLDVSNTVIKTCNVTVP